MPGTIPIDNLGLQVLNPQWWECPAYLMLLHRDR
jgi:hypothetical protein